MWRRNPIPRSTFWFLVDHVGISFVLTMFSLLFLGFAVVLTAEHGPPYVLFTLAASIASVIGTGVSIRNLRSFKIEASPLACTIPAIAMYATGMTGLMWLVTWGRFLSDSTLFVLTLGVVGSTSAIFGGLTWRAFQKITGIAPPGFDVEKAHPVEPIVEPQHFIEQTDARDVSHRR